MFLKVKMYFAYGARKYWIIQFKLIRCSAQQNVRFFKRPRIHFNKLKMNLTKKKKLKASIAQLCPITILIENASTSIKRFRRGFLCTQLGAFFYRWQLLQSARMFVCI